MRAARATSTAPGPWIGLEPKAIEILKASSARLAAARTMTLHGGWSATNT